VTHNLVKALYLETKFSGNLQKTRHTRKWREETGIEG